MAATALIRFRRDNNTPTTFPNGQAIVGSIGDQIRVWNSVNTDVQSWQIDLVYTPPDSVIPTATPLIFNDASGTPDSGVITLDATGGYRFVLKVWDIPNRLGEPTDVDIRNVLVPETSGFISPPSAFWPQPLPPPQSLLPEAKPEENNIGGQDNGWAGTGSDGLLTHLIRVAAASAGYVDSAIAAAIAGIFVDVNITETFRLSGVLTPAQITATQNDYNPAGLADATTLRLSSDALRPIHGIAGGTAGRVLHLINVGSNPISLLSENAGSVAANRFLLRGTIYLEPGDSVTVWWDPTSSRWRATSYVTALSSSFFTVNATTGFFELANAGVSFAKIQDITTDRLLGRDTTGTGVVEEISVTNGLAFTGTGGIGIATDGVTTARILNSNVTFAKIQNITSDRLLGRDTASAGVVEELTVGNGLEFTGAGGIGIANDGVTTARILNANVTYAKIQNVAASRLLGRSAGSPGAPEELSLNARLTITGSTLTLAANGIDNTVLAQMATLTLKGNNTGGTANAADLTVSQVQTMLRDSWTYIGFAGTVPAIGLLRAPHASTILAIKENGGTDRALLTWGVVGTNELQLGNVGGGDGNLVLTATGGTIYDGASPLLTAGSVIRTFRNHEFESTVANPFLYQLNAASGGANPLTIRARGSTGAANAGSDLRLEPGRPGAGGASGVGRLRGNRDDSTFDEAFAWDTSGSAARIGFFGATPAVKPSIAGARADGTALADLLTKFSTLGLLTDTTTAGSSSSSSRKVYAAFYKASFSQTTTEAAITWDLKFHDEYGSVDYNDSGGSAEVDLPTPGYYLVWLSASALAAVPVTTELNMTVAGASVASANAGPGPNMAGTALFWCGLNSVGTRVTFPIDMSATTTLAAFAAFERVSDDSTESSACMAEVTTTSSTTEGAIAFNAADILDTHSYHDPVTNNTRFTAPATGVYECWAGVSSVAAQNSVEIGIRQDGTTFRGYGVTDGPATGSSGAIAFALVSLTAAQYLEMVVDTETATSRIFRMFMRRIDNTSDSLCAAVVTGLTSTTTEAAIAFSAADLVDTNNYHDPVTNNTRFTAPTSGAYEFVGNLSGPSGTTHELILRKNGSTDIACSSNVDSVAAYNTVGSTLLWVGWLAAGEYLELRADWGTSSVAGFWAQALMRRRSL